MFCKRRNVFGLKGKRKYTALKVLGVDVEQLLHEYLPGESEHDPLGGDPRQFARRLEQLRGTFFHRS